MHILNFSTTFFLYKLVCHYYSGCFKALQLRNIYNHFDVAMLAYFALIVEDCMYYWTQMFAFRHTPQLKYEIFFLLLMMPFVISGYVQITLMCATIWTQHTLWARGSVALCRDGPISKWRLQSMY